ncbi:Fumarylacetoacetase-like, C-terminal [Dillenia turbinata]|uniref:Fumarylacetoacetase n=1 Tax=Dillenia turbinata TaxID=194707 RepID=A0AAN8VEK5_9MAGN
MGPNLFMVNAFGTTISPWIVTLEDLEPFACDAPKQDPPPLPYLAEKISQNHDISLDAYWTLTQQLAHHIIKSNQRPGDLLGTGTIGGPFVLASWDFHHSSGLEKRKKKIVELPSSTSYIYAAFLAPVIVVSGVEVRHAAPTFRLQWPSYQTNVTDHNIGSVKPFKATKRPNGRPELKFGKSAKYNEKVVVQSLAGRREGEELTK